MSAENNEGNAATFRIGAADGRGPEPVTNSTGGIGLSASGASAFRWAELCHQATSRRLSDQQSN